MNGSFAGMNALARIDAGQLVEWGAVLGASLTAGLWDLRTQRIPNRLTLPLTLLGLGWAAGNQQLRGLEQAVLAWFVLSLPYLVLFYLGQGGAGDAKMMGAIGVWIGVRQGLVVLASVTLIGAVLAVLKLLLQNERRIVFRALGAALFVQVVASAGGGRNLPEAGPEGPSNGCGRRATVPYGVAIFLGVCLGAIVVHLWMP